MKFSVSTYSYCRLISSGEKTLLECIALAAETGFDGVEFVGFDTPEGLTAAEYAAMLRDECKKHGVEPVSYTIGADFLYGSDGDIEKEIERVKAEVDIANILGVKLMRHDATRGYDNCDRGYKAFGDALPRIIEGCRAVTEYAAQYGIRTMVENHGYFCQESCRVEKIVNGVANDNFGLLVDIGNFMCADEDPVKSVGILAPYAIHAHAKDFHWKSGMDVNPGEGWFQTRAGNYLRGAIIGHGDAKAYQSIQILKREGYDGFITIEFEGMEDNIVGLENGLANLKRFIG